MKIAVVGSGAAAAATLHMIYRADPGAEVVNFDLTAPVAEKPRVVDRDPRAVASFYDGVYRQLKADVGLKFPPVKTHFGHSIGRYLVGGEARFFRGEGLGGLTNYWGATMLPFSNRDLEAWPVRQNALDPYYREMAEVVGISGRRDALTQTYGQEYSNRPAIELLPGIAKLADTVNARGEGAPGFRVRAGINRVALETRPGLANSCLYSGECMAGCLPGAVYSSRSTILALTARFNLRRVEQTVRSVSRGTVTARRRNGVDETHTGFDRIYLAAGCVGTAEIAMRSLGIKRGLELVDNAIYQFPVLHLGRTGGPRVDRRRYFSLSSLLFSCESREPGASDAQVQVYPNFDYLWRNAVPEALWPLIRGPVNLMRDRLLWARLYLHSRHCYAYELALDEHDELVIREIRKPDRSPLTALMPALRHAIQARGFYVVPVKPVMSKTSNHLAGPLKYGGGLVNLEPGGEVVPGVFVCDSSCFPDSPATSPTFTIMANAARTVVSSLGAARDS